MRKPAAVGVAKLEYVLLLVAVAALGAGLAGAFGGRVLRPFAEGPSRPDGPSPAHAEPAPDPGSTSENAPAPLSRRPRSGDAPAGEDEPLHGIYGEGLVDSEPGFEGEGDQERRRATCEEWARLGELLRTLVGGEDEPDDETRRRLEEAERRIRDENPTWTEDKRRDRVLEAREGILRETRERRLRRAREAMDEAAAELARFARFLDETRRQRDEAEALAAKAKVAREQEAKLRDESAHRRAEARAELDSAEAEEKKGERHNGLFAKARREAAGKANEAADRLDARAKEAAREAAQWQRQAEAAAAVFARQEVATAAAMQAPRQRFEEARAAILRDHARVVRQSQIARLDTFAADAFNPGEHEPAAGRHHVTLAKYVLGDGEVPWKGWGRDARDFGQRIVTHELAHALMSANPDAAQRFLDARWKGMARALTAQRKAVMDEFNRRRAELARDPEWECRPERDRKIEALLRTGPHVRALQMLFQARHPGSPGFPTRFPGDLHAFRDEREYFAVALELYFHDPDLFASSYSAQERQALAGLLAGDSPNDLRATRATRQK